MTHVILKQSSSCKTEETLPLSHFSPPTSPPKKTNSRFMCSHGYSQSITNGILCRKLMQMKPTLWPFSPMCTNKWGRAPSPPASVHLDFWVKQLRQMKQLCGHYSPKDGSRELFTFKSFQQSLVLQFWVNLFLQFYSTSVLLPLSTLLKQFISWLELCPFSQQRYFCKKL